MKKIFLILLLFNLFGSLLHAQNPKKYTYDQIIEKPKEECINEMYTQLNDYRSDLDKMDNEIRTYIGNSKLKYTRAKSKKKLHPFILSKKLCYEAQKRCEYNYKQRNDKYGITHRYGFYECEENISAKITSGLINKTCFKEIIRNLIIDVEPLVVGHRESLLNENEDYKYVGFGYKIYKEKGKYDDIITLVVFVLISTGDGLRSSVNFNNTYVDLSKIKVITNPR